jgi:addiction module HigA family antidote
MIIHDIGGVKFQMVKTNYPDTKQFRPILINLENEKAVPLSVSDPHVPLENGNQFLVSGGSVGFIFTDAMTELGLVKHVQNVRPGLDVYEYLEPETEPIHPGIHLYNDFLKPNELSKTAFCDQVQLGWNSVARITAGKRGIAITAAIKLAKYFNWTTPEYWVDLQTQYDLARFKKGEYHNNLEKEALEALEKVQPFRPDPRKIKKKK